jgi:hypothetical protein
MKIKTIDTACHCEVQDDDTVTLTVTVTGLTFDQAMAISPRLRDPVQSVVHDVVTEGGKVLHQMVDMSNKGRMQ